MGLAGLRAAHAATIDDVLGDGAYSRSKTAAAPMPPPMHMLTTP